MYEISFAISHFSHYPYYDSSSVFFHIKHVNSYSQIRACRNLFRPPRLDRLLVKNNTPKSLFIKFLVVLTFLKIEIVLVFLFYNIGCRLHEENLAHKYRIVANHGLPNNHSVYYILKSA